jgi:hypothetical protein
MDSQREKELDELMDWVSSRLRFNDVPRVTDIHEQARIRKFKVSKRDIAKRLRLHEIYHMNMPQQRQRNRSKKYRGIVTNTLGNLHCDIGKFPIVREYETPVTYRAGYLIARDVLSRYIYVVLLRKEKSADALVRAFEELIAYHSRVHPGHRIKSVSFDKEPGVMSRKVQDFFAENNISFHAFQMSASKAKMAEGGIRQIRATIARLMRQNRPKDRWWNLLQPAADTLNSQTVHVDGKSTHFAPKDINVKNLPEFIETLHRLAPSYYFSQFDIAPNLVDFRYAVGMKVRPKLIITSSATVGEKRSEVNLKKDVYEIEKLVPFVTRDMTIGRAYKCLHVDTGETEVFEEDDLALV